MPATASGREPMPVLRRPTGARSTMGPARARHGPDRRTAAGIGSDGRTLTGATIPRVCDWPECFRPVATSQGRYCGRHRPYCAVPGCRKRAEADRRTCQAHHKGRDPVQRQPKRHRPQLSTCVACGRSPTVARSLCWRHLQRLYRTGTTAEPAASDGACRYCSERLARDGLCIVHARRLERGDDLGPPRRINAGRVCAVLVDGALCGRPAYHKGQCSRHYQRAYHAAKRAATLTADIGT